MLRLYTSGTYGAVGDEDITFLDQVCLRVTPSMVPASDKAILDAWAVEDREGVCCDSEGTD